MSFRASAVTDVSLLESKVVFKGGGGEVIGLVSKINSALQTQLHPLCQVSQSECERARTADGAVQVSQLVFV